MLRPMKKMVCRIMAATVMLAVLLPLCWLPLCSAAGSASFTMSCNNTTPAPGDTVTVTVSVSSSTQIGALDMSVGYDGGKLELQGVSGFGNYTTGNPVVVSYYSQDGTTGLQSGQLVISFKVKSEVSGSAKLSLNVTECTDLEKNAIPKSSGGLTLNITQPPPPPPLSSVKTLSSLTLSNGSLSPAFLPSVTSYTATVENSVGSVTVGAKTTHANATVSGTGNYTLTEGQARAVTLTVKAEDGSTQNYTVSITRKKGVGAGNATSSTAAPSRAASSARSNASSTRSSVSSKQSDSSLQSAGSYDAPLTSEEASAGIVIAGAVEPSSSVAASAISSTYSEAETGKSKNNPLTYILIAAGIVAGIVAAGVVIIILVNRKMSQHENTIEDMSSDVYNYNEP